VVGSCCPVAGRLRGDDAVAAPSLTGRSSLVEVSLAAGRCSYLSYVCMLIQYGKLAIQVDEGLGV
jgi:hypothetical protein